MSVLAFVRHGIFSNDQNLSELAGALERADFFVANQKYEWRASVLMSGIGLAASVATESRESPTCDIVLVGHSQGGLVCRVAAAALCCPAGLQAAITGARPVEGRYRREALDALDSLRKESDTAAPARKLRGVVMLATPNSGAITFGQLSLLGKCVLRTAQLIGELGLARDVTDLTTDRLFRILQRVSVPRVRYLSVSGSYTNRFSVLSHADLAHIPMVRRLGLQLSTPNDLLVEDDSVDIQNAVLPPEIESVAEQYEHVRWYPDCSDVSHTTIHSEREVQQLVIKRIRSWCTPRAISEPSTA